MHLFAQQFVHLFVAAVALQFVVVTVVGSGELLDVFVIFFFLSLHSSQWFISISSLFFFVLNYLTTFLEWELALENPHPHLLV